MLPIGTYDSATAEATLSWTPRYESNIYATITCQSSPDFSTWADVPASRITVGPDGTHTARVAANGGTQMFLRLRF